MRARGRQADTFRDGPLRMAAGVVQPGSSGRELIVVRRSDANTYLQLVAGHHTDDVSHVGEISFIDCIAFTFRPHINGVVSSEH